MDRGEDTLGETLGRNLDTSCSSESRLGWARQTRGDVYSVYSLAALHSAYRGAGAGSSSCRGLVLLLQGSGSSSCRGLVL